jgi:uncharacterized protein (TIGR01777 family)
MHEREDAFSLLTPASEAIKVISKATTLAPSSEVVRFQTRFLFFKFNFGMVHTVYRPPDLFVDEQKEGLFSHWRHHHVFIQGGWAEDPACLLRDRIEYAHPLLPFFNPFVKRKLGSLFEFRHRTTAREVSEVSPKPGRAVPPLVVITGATGLIGGRIARILLEKGIRVKALSRNIEKAKRLLGDEAAHVHWDFHHPERGGWKEAVSQADGIIHLAGTPLFSQRWTRKFKREMEDSRVLSTRQLVDAVLASGRRPKSFISASALGIYGTGWEQPVTEDSPPAGDLLARICVKWEDETNRLEAENIRTVQIRIGIVLSTKSGALKELLPLFRFGMGGVMGSARPWMNWIHLEDVARIFTTALFNDRMKGPYNAAAPNPVTNGEFAKSIGRVLRRPALMRFPTPLLKLMIGEAGGYASGGPQVRADKIRAAGYTFFFEELEPALSNLLHRS